MNRPLLLQRRAARTRSGAAASKPAAPTQNWARDTRGSLLIATLVWVLISYLVIPAPYLQGETSLVADYAMAAGNPLGRAIKFGLLIFSVLIILWRSNIALLAMRAVNPFFTFFLVLVPASIVWSINPGATTARYINVLSTVSVCLAFTLVGWHRTRFQNVVRPVVTILLAASVIFGILHPEYAIEVGDGTLKDSWRGLTAQKNQFGMLASFGVVFWLHAWFSREAKWWVALPGAILGWACVLLSRSSTSLLASSLSTLFMVLVMVAPSNLRRFMPYIVSAFAVLVVVYALAVLNLIPGIGILLDPIAELSGKDLTFSNRAVIWDIIKEHIQLAPFLGSGYGAYWTGALPSSPSYVFMGRMYFYPSQSHNGYLEIVNDLGFVGLFCLLGYLVFWVRQSLQLMKIDRGQGMLFLALFFQQAITNLSESTWLAVNSAFAIAVGTLATFALSRALLERRLKGHFTKNRGRTRAAG